MMGGVQERGWVESVLGVRLGVEVGSPTQQVAEDEEQKRNKSAAKAGELA